MDSNIKIIDLCIYLENERVLILGDVHMGHEEHMNKQGILVPRQQFQMTIERLEKTLKKVKPEVIIVNGDIKEEFGEVSETEWRHTLKLIDFLAGHCKKLFLIKGNHDIFLEPIAKKRNIEVVDNFIADNILITHGDKIQPEAKLKGIKTIIIGHEHPAISIADYPRVEKYKCFLVGRWKDKELIVMPTYNLLIEGKDVMRENPLSPFIDKFDNFDVYVVSDKIYEFGKVKSLRKMD